jgi:hypothetical protein
MPMPMTVILQSTTFRKWQSQLTGAHFRGALLTIAMETVQLWKILSFDFVRDEELFAFCYRPNDLQIVGCMGVKPAHWGNNCD